MNIFLTDDSDRNNEITNKQKLTKFSKYLTKNVKKNTDDEINNKKRYTMGDILSQFNTNS